MSSVPEGPCWLLLGDVGFGEDQSGDGPLGQCVEIDGLFADLPARPRERLTLVGCRPEPLLSRAIDAVGGTTRAAERDRWVRVDPHAVSADGSTGRLFDAMIAVTVLGAEPSRCGGGLLVVALGRHVHRPDRPAGATYELDGRFVTDIEGFYCAPGRGDQRSGRLLRTVPRRSRRLPGRPFRRCG